jgi:hypothetical protein
MSPDNEADNRACACGDNKRNVIHQRLPPDRLAYLISSVPNLDFRIPRRAPSRSGRKHVARRADQKA